MLQLQSPSIPGTYSTKIWMSTELAENRDLGPLGHPHHCSVHGFCRIFITNLKTAQGLRDLPSLTLMNIKFHTSSIRPRVRLFCGEQHFEEIYSRRCCL